MSVSLGALYSVPFTVVFLQSIEPSFEIVACAVYMDVVFRLVTGHEAPAISPLAGIAFVSIGAPLTRTMLL